MRKSNMPVRRARRWRKLAWFGWCSAAIFDVLLPRIYAAFLILLSNLARFYLHQLSSSLQVFLKAALPTLTSFYQELFVIEYFHCYTFIIILGSSCPIILAAPFDLRISFYLYCALQP